MVGNLVGGVRVGWWVVGDENYICQIASLGSQCVAFYGMEQQQSQADPLIHVSLKTSEPTAPPSTSNFPIKTPFPFSLPDKKETLISSSSILYN